MNCTFDAMVTTSLDYKTCYEFLSSTGTGIALSYRQLSQTLNHMSQTMIDSNNKPSDYDEIAKVVDLYLEGAKSGKGEEMRAAFHRDATIFGYVGSEFFAGPIQKLFRWNDENGPATALEARIANIDLADSVATVRLELDNWTGHRFTDLFTLLKVDGQWKIMNKVFHLHA